MTDERPEEAPKIHELKTWLEFFGALVTGEKAFEIRENDRDFRVGDVLWLREWNPSFEMYSGRSLRCIVTYITDWRQRPGVVVMGFRR